MTFYLKKKILKLFSEFNLRFFYLIIFGNFHKNLKGFHLKFATKIVNFSTKFFKNSYGIFIWKYSEIVIKRKFDRKKSQKIFENVVFFRVRVLFKKIQIILDFYLWFFLNMIFFGNFLKILEMFITLLQNY